MESENGGHCVAFGHCGVDPGSNMPMQCEYLGPPQEITNQSVLQTLYSFCPQYVNVSDNGIHLISILNIIFAILLLSGLEPSFPV